MKNIEIKKSVLEIIDMLCDQSMGFEDWFYNLDDEKESELIKKIENILTLRLK
jgi:hypothetical protein